MQQIILTLIFDLKGDRAIFSNWLQKYFKMRAFRCGVVLRNVKGLLLAKPDRSWRPVRFGDGFKNSLPLLPKHTR
jgi:hypothetical protein